MDLRELFFSAKMWTLWNIGAAGQDMEDRLSCPSQDLIFKGPWCLLYQIYTEARAWPDLPCGVMLWAG